MRDAQEAISQLLMEVKLTRSERDEAGQVLDDLRSDISVAREVAFLDSVERANLERQHQELIDKESSTQAEIAILCQEIKDSEHRIFDAEEAAKRTRENSIAIEKAKLASKVARQRAERQANDSDWRLQKAVVRLDKVKPGVPLAKGLSSSRLFCGHSGDGSSGGAMCRPARIKRHAGHDKFGTVGGSDADVESTTAGESSADCLLGIGGIVAE